MAIVTPGFVKALFTGFNKQFQDGLAIAPSAYQDVATVINSTTASNTYGWLGQFPRFREWIGARVIKDMQAHGYTIVNKKYESTVAVARTDIEDDNLGIYAPAFTEMGRAAAAHPDELVFSLLKTGNSAVCFDGQNFFDTDHPVYENVDGTGTVTTVSNIFTGAAASPAWYLLDTTRALKPLIYQKRTAAELTTITDVKDEAVFMQDEFRYGVRVRGNSGFGFWQLASMSSEELNKENFEKVYDAMRSLKADGGRPLDVRPNLLVVPTNLRSKANEVINVQRLANGADNPNFGLVKVLETAWLN